MDNAADRTRAGAFKTALSVFSLGWVVFQLYFNTIGSMEAITFRAYHAMFLLLYCFCVYPNREKKNRRGALPGVFDLIL
ncbi:MAG: TRAP transporter permease, partial [Spirochaetaceae bacterium]|nr:TRAP transporter permease [Spirochaetaceae bacterium]